MPNYVYNKLTITGPNKSLKKFIKLVQTDKTNFDFNKILPMPSILDQTSFPVRERNQKLINKYGFDNWYEWRLHNWGVKWDASDASEWEKELPTEMRITYTTAWSCAEGILKNASKQFPDILFRNTFVDEPYENIGFIIYENDELIKTTTYNIKSNKAKGIFNDVGLDYPESEEDTEPVKKSKK
jgi:hypothetical protein